MTNIGILVVDRFQLFRRRSRGVPKRFPVRGQTHQAVATAYSGFDGSVWPDIEEAQISLSDGLAEMAELDAVLAYAHALPNAAHLDVLAVTREPAVTTGPPGVGWNWVGFDVGYYESQWSHFSVLLNEVVYGINPSLAACAMRLNENLLCDSEEQVADVLAERALLLARGADLELAGPAMRLVGIYRLADRARPSLGGREYPP